MDETPEQKFDRISRAVQESILRTCPHPGPKAGPGGAVVRAVAGRPVLKADAAWEHTTPCSRCYPKSLALKHASRPKKASRGRRAPALIAPAAAAIPVVVVSRF